MDKLIRCGLWVNAKNSRRCHLSHLCPLCHWVDDLKLLVEAYGEESGAFAKARLWSFVTLGFTSNPNNSKWSVKNFELQDPERPGADPELFADADPGLLAGVDRSYNPYPVALGPTRDDPSDPWMGYDDAGQPRVWNGRPAIQAVP